MTPFQMVREFHEAFDLPVHSAPTYPRPSEINLRIRLIQEEAEEAEEALDYLGWKAARTPENLARAAQELADVVYVAYGTALYLGVDLDAVFAEVHAANMRKLDPHGKPIRRADGKVMKPNDWKPADVFRVIFGEGV